MKHRWPFIDNAGGRSAAENQLMKQLAHLLPDARVEATVLPQCKEISLFLMNPDDSKRALSEKQARYLMVEPMYWAVCWASGHALASFLLRHPEWVAGKKVLDFGCGSGVAAIAAAKAGAAKVWASDIDPMALQATRMNCRLNSVFVEVIDDWTACGEFPDLILAADILYDSANRSYLDRFPEQAGEVLVADSRVKDIDHPLFERIGHIRSFTIPDLGELPEFGRVNLYHGQKKQTGLKKLARHRKNS